MPGYQCPVVSEANTAHYSPFLWYFRNISPLAQPLNPTQSGTHCGI